MMNTHRIFQISLEFQTIILYIYQTNLEKKCPEQKSNGKNAEQKANVRKTDEKKKAEEKKLNVVWCV